MQKKYVFIIFYFLSNNAKAQLSQDLAKFTKTLKNVAAKLTEVPPSRVITVPASGKVTLSGSEDVEAPPGSTIEVRSTGVTVKVPPVGGKVQLPSTGGIIQVSVDSEVDARIQPAPYDILLRKVEDLSAGKTISFPAGDIKVTITPKGIVVPVEQLPANFIISGGIHVKVPPNGRIETSDDYFMKVPLDSKVTKYPDEVFDIGLPSGGLVKLANNETITAPAGSTIRSTKYGPIVFIPSRGGDIIIPPDTSIITLVDSTAKDSKGTKDIPALKEITSYYGGVIKIIPIIPFGGVEVKVPAAGGDIKLSTGEVINVPKGSSVKEFSDEVNTILITLSSDGSVTLPNKKVIKAPAGSKIKLTKEESIVIIPISESGVSATLPANTKFYVSSPAMVRAANMPDTKATPGEYLSPPIDVTITLTPLRSFTL